MKGTNIMQSSITNKKVINTLVQAGYGSTSLAYILCELEDHPTQREFILCYWLNKSAESQIIKELLKELA